MFLEVLIYSLRIIKEKNLSSLPFLKFQLFKNKNRQTNKTSKPTVTFVNNIISLDQIDAINGQQIYKMFLSSSAVK